MKKSIITACLAFVLLSQCFAQNSDSGHGTSQAPITPAQTSRLWKFRSQEYGGLVTGQEGNYGQGYTINGIYKGPWSLGVGAGLDFYRYRTIPLFLSAERELMAPGHSGWFVRLDAGVNFPWQSEPSYYYPSGASFSGHLLTAPYGNALIGYKIFVNARHNQALLISAGYGLKEVREKQVVTNYCPVMVMCNNDPAFNTDRYTYYNNRVSMQLGYQF